MAYHDLRSMTQDEPFVTGDELGEDGPSPMPELEPEEKPAGPANAVSAVGRSDERVARLRGADVRVDARKAGWVALILALCILLVLAVVFTVAGARKNNQIQELKDHAVPVDAVVTSCVGLLGGSGSNFVGYACTGTYRVANRRYTEQLPGSAPHARGDVVHIVVAPSDPALVSTRALVASEHASWRVFILPGVLFLVVLLTATALLVIRRKRVAVRTP